MACAQCQHVHKPTTRLKRSLIQIIEGNCGDGVHVKNEGAPEVRGNEVCRSEGHGIHVCREGKGTYVGNQVHGNRKDGITLRSGANGTVKDNVVFGKYLALNMPECSEYGYFVARGMHYSSRVLQCMAAE